MLIALFADIHANREAFEACLSAAETAGANHSVILGDIVGYGADPEWCTARAMEMLEAGHVVIRGNHDQAVSDPDPDMNNDARQALAWTANQLGQQERAFLKSLPLQILEEDRLYVHADASAPENWNYVKDSDDARLHFKSCRPTFSFCGHIHRPALYGVAPQAKVISFVPNSTNPLPLLPGRKWLGVMGSVGQPRDGNPQAAFGLLDTDRNMLRFMRTTYDVETAAAKIRAAGLPVRLADRLQKGQ
jgi:diadenosine tetraphosphatase ApaH/serine/threonine PP2A family protein phosphatase